MDLVGLKNLDVKKLDPKEIQKTLTNRQDIFVNILVTLATFFFMFQIVSGKQAESKLLKSRISNLEKKIESINKNKQSVKELEEFTSTLPDGVPGNLIVDKLTDFAEKRGVQIVYVSPTETEIKNHFDRTSVNVNLTAKSYKDLWLFIYDIETSPDNLRIDRWSGLMESNRRNVLNGRVQGMDIVETINAQMDIGSIKFKK